MFTNTLSAATLSIALGLVIPLNSADAEGCTATIVNVPQTVTPSSCDVTQLILRLRRMRRLPGVLLDLAEKAYRFYKLVKFDHDLQAVRETSVRALRELDRLAMRIEQGEVRLADLEAVISRQERAIAELDARLSAGQAPARANK